MEPYEADNLFKKAQTIRYRNKTSSFELYNYLEYQREQLYANRTFFSCGICRRSNTTIANQYFRRAFSTMTRDYQAAYYLMNVYLLYEVLDDNNEMSRKQDKNIKNSKETGDISSERILGDDTSPQYLSFHDSVNNVPCEEVWYETKNKSWYKIYMKFYYTDGIIKTDAIPEILDFHNYLLRKSKKVDKLTLALESTQALQRPETIRVSNCKQTYEELRARFYRGIRDALKENIAKILKTGTKYKKKITIVPENKKSGGVLPLDSLRHLNQKQGNNSSFSHPLPVLDNPKIKLVPLELETETKPRNSPTVKQQNNKYFAIERKVKFEYPKLEILKYSLKIPIANSDVMRPNVSYSETSNKLRKTYTFDTSISFYWLCDQLYNYPSFVKWKPSLQKTKIIVGSSNYTKRMFIEQHRFSNKSYISYSYYRKKIKNVQKPHDDIYFVDWSAEDVYGGSTKGNVLKKEDKIKMAEGTVHSVIWYFHRHSDAYIVTVEACISHSSLKNQKLTDYFLGEFSSVMSNLNVTLINYSDVNINTMMFEEGFFSIINGDDFENFYSIYEESFTDKNSLKNNYSQKVIKDDLNKKILTKNILAITNGTSHYLQQIVSSIPVKLSFLTYKHQLVPAPKQYPKLVIPPKGEHVYWYNYWRITEKGEVISINQKKIKAQSNILKSLITSIGRSFLSGRGILNVSLPVQCFGGESNLSLLGKSYSYAPHLLEPVASSTCSPLYRMKKVIAFMITSSIGTLRMDKPFNPILGETYQATIYGCPLYAYQISHHPPISALYFLGRGYKLNGTFELKVDLGINTANGKNEGTLYVDFDNAVTYKQTTNKKDIVNRKYFQERNNNAKKIRLNFPVGQLTGLTVGDRWVSMIKKSQVLDPYNRIFAEFSWGKQKTNSNPEADFYDCVSGDIVELKPGTNMDDFLKIPKEAIAKTFGLVHGRWTGKVFFEKYLILDTYAMFPYMVESDPVTLYSDVYKRKDLILTVKYDLYAAQIAKYDMEILQRNDRKLREKFTGKKQH